MRTSLFKPTPEEYLQNNTQPTCPYCEKELILSRQNIKSEDFRVYCPQGCFRQIFNIPQKTIAPALTYTGRYDETPSKWKLKPLPIEIEDFLTHKLYTGIIGGIKNYALITGGLYPPNASLEDTVLLADKNLISAIIGNYRDGQSKSPTPSMFDAPCNVSVSPLLYLLEGNIQEEPPLEVIKQQALEVNEKLSRALPWLHFEKLNPEIVHERLLAQSQFDTKRLNFLYSCQNIIGKVIKKDNSKRRKLWSEIIEAAEKSGLRRNDLMVLLVLSSISARQGDNPALRILKYSPEHAYNALCDIRNLDVLQRATGRFKDEKFIFITEDYNLAKFWIALSARNQIYHIDGHTEFTANFSKALFDVEREEILFLIETLQAH